MMNNFKKYNYTKGSEHCHNSPPDCMIDLAGSNNTITLFPYKSTSSSENNVCQWKVSTIPTKRIKITVKRSLENNLDLEIGVQQQNRNNPKHYSWRDFYDCDNTVYEEYTTNATSVLIYAQKMTDNANYTVTIEQFDLDTPPPPIKSDVSPTEDSTPTEN